MTSLNPLMFQQYFFLCAIGALFVRFKNFMPTPVAGLSFVFLLLFAFKIYPSGKTSRWLVKGLAAALAISVVFVSSQLIYSHFPFGSYVLGAFLALCFLVAALKTDQFSQKKISFFYSFIFLLVGGTVIFTSPKPRIDVHEMLTRSSSLILKGESPYHNRAAVPDETYYIKNGMKALLELYTSGGQSLGFVPYSPQILLTSTLGFLLGDVRFGFVICLSLALFLLGLVIKDRDVFKIIAATLVSISVFLIEQAWSEPVVFLSFVLLIWANQAGFRRLTPVLVGFLAISKIYMLPIVGFYLVAESVKRDVKDFISKSLLVSLGIIGPYLLFMLWGPDNVINHILKDLLFLNDFDYPFSNSLANHLNRQMNLKFYFLGPICLLGVFAANSVFSKKRNLEDALAAFSLGLFLFMLFNKTFFYNYAWVCVLMLIVCRGFSGWEKKIREEDFLYFSSRFLVVFFLPMILSDIWHYAKLASQMLQGKILYLDFVFEYPPLSALQIFLPGWMAFKLGNMNIMLYRLFFMLSCLYFDWRIYQLLKEKKQLSIKNYILGTTILAPLIFERLDLVMMWFIVISVYLAEEKSENQSIILTTLGGWYKLMPFIGLVVLFKNSPNKKLLIYKFLGLNLVILTIASFFFKSETLSFLSYHSSRPYQIESLVSSLAIFLNKFLEFGVSIENSFGSGNLIFGGWELTQIINKTFLLLTAGVLCLIYLRNKITGKDFLASTFLVFVTFSPVLSTQYILWILITFLFSDFYSFVSPWFHRSMIAVCVLSAGIFFKYFDLVMLNEFMTSLLLARNLLLVIMSVYLVQFLLESSALTDSERNS